MLADKCKQPLLALGALAARLGESGGDDDQCSNPGAESVLRGGQHLRARNADDREVGRLRDVSNGAVAVDTRDRVAAAVDRVGGAGEVRGQDVAKQLTADRAAALRCADDRHRTRAEERIE